MKIIKNSFVTSLVLVGLVFGTIVVSAQEVMTTTVSPQSAANDTVAPKEPTAVKSSEPVKTTEPVKEPKEATRNEKREERRENRNEKREERKENRNKKREEKRGEKKDDKKEVDIACVRAAIEKREDSLIEAFNAYVAKESEAQKTRREGILAAWGVQNKEERRSMIKNVKKEYHKALEANKMAWRKQQREIVKQFGKAISGCSGATPEARENFEF